jgi:ribosomal protein L7/L12
MDRNIANSLLVSFLMNDTPMNNARIVRDLAAKYPAILCELLELTDTAPAPTVSGEESLRNTRYALAEDAGNTFDDLRDMDNFDRYHKIEDLCRNEKVRAIKTVRIFTGLGLKESKDIADNIQSFSFGSGLMVDKTSQEAIDLFNEYFR